MSCPGDQPCDRVRFSREYCKLGTTTTHHQAWAMPKYPRGDGTETTEPVGKFRAIHKVEEESAYQTLRLAYS
jgi:hypothetical protein